MDRIQKFIRKLSKRERQQILSIVERVQEGNINGLDVKKLQGRDQEFRIRKGNIRIIFRRTASGFEVIDIQWRGSKTYH